MYQVEGINIAVEGCFHGNFDEIFAEVVEFEKKKQIKIDLITRLWRCSNYEKQK
ncbi:unnamed protein product (macronuclear) [Paramecium tetraurelia]|uniref:Uncharacterized protein n=1 Tax=Paramecium tetraurelia TaxID=5888 RepID=A0BBX4_PARTE|nr:uncharacterized protein GSPATT00000476001 [Paramecium tetraurelia]CAK56041.1 unnamed protein product [Paramecium tetraurelia]|eukprot:XP_001423439.1 hypothetical protein (macronuclear) [Paramecium tetraurelia strain d4-2]